MALKVGFVGTGIMGEPMARNLLRSNKFAKVTVWNRSPAKAALAVVQGETGIVSAMVCALVLRARIIFMLTLLGVYTDEVTSQQIYSMVTASGGRFLEAPVSGSKKPAIDGQLIFLAAGNKELFEECHDAFDIMGKAAIYLGDVGAGARMKLTVNMIMGSMMCAFAEGMQLAQKSDLKQEDLLHVLSLGAMANPMFALKGPAMLKSTFPPAFPLKHQQKDMRLALALGDALQQPMPVAAAANEEYKQAMASGLGDDDFAAVYSSLNTDSLK